MNDKSYSTAIGFMVGWFRISARRESDVRSKVEAGVGAVGERFVGKSGGFIGIENVGTRGPMVSCSGHLGYHHLPTHSHQLRLHPVVPVHSLKGGGRGGEVMIV